MKFAFAFLLALFAVLCVCQAYPQPAEQATASQGEDVKAGATSDDQLIAQLKANPNGRLWWTLIGIGANMLANVFKG